jgi:hypothetical protein
MVLAALNMIEIFINNYFIVIIMSNYIMSPSEFRKEFGRRPNYKGHVLIEEKTEPVERIVVMEGLPLEDYRDGILRSGLSYDIIEAPENFFQWLYTRILATEFDGEDFAAFKVSENGLARRHLKVSGILEGEEGISATTAHHDYTGKNPVKRIRSHLPKIIPVPLRIHGDYKTGENRFIDELKRYGLLS